MRENLRDRVVVKLHVQVCVCDHRPLRDDEVLPVRKHRVVAGAAASLKGEESTEEVSHQSSY